MTKTRKQKPVPKFIALKARLAVEARLVEQGIAVVVDDFSLLIRSKISQMTWYFKETEAGQLEVTFATLIESASAQEMEDHLATGIHPPDTELQILHAAGHPTPVGIARRIYPARFDPLELVYWGTTCDNVFRGGEAMGAYDPSDNESAGPPEAEALRQTNEALLDLLAPDIGTALRVLASNGPEGVVSYGFPAGKAYFQLVILPMNGETCSLNASVLVGRLFNRHAYAIRWLLRNCTHRFLTVRPSGNDEENLEVGFCGYVPKGFSLPLVQTLGRVFEEAEAIALGLGLWFPNLIDGNIVGSVLGNSEDPEVQMPLMAISNPVAFIAEWREYLRENPGTSLDGACFPFKATLWAEDYTTALEWGHTLETTARAAQPSDREGEQLQESALTFSRQLQVRAYKALGKYEEALALFETLAAAQPPEAQNMTFLIRASLYVRLRRWDEALATLDQITENPEPVALLGRSLALVGLGHSEEAEAAFEAYEDEAGPDIAARALFHELQSEHEHKQEKEPVTEALRRLEQEIDEDNKPDEEDELKQ